MNATATTTTATRHDAPAAQYRLRPDAFFVWKDTFRLGIAAVDRDHQRFFELINSVHECVVLGKDEAVVRATLAALVRYAREHFIREEEELEEIGYPHLAQHEAEHRYFLQQLQRITREPTASARRTLALAQEWLVEHILHTDNHYVVWLRNS